MEWLCRISPKSSKGILMKKVLLAFACASLILMAADPWKDKQSSDWTEKDANRVLTNSPWAQTASAQMDSSQMGGGMGRGGGMGGPGGGIGGPGGGPEDGIGGGGGGMRGPGGGMGGPVRQAPKILVRWESAAPVREAAVRLENPQASTLAELTKDYYVVSTSGMPLMGGERRNPRDQSQDRPRPDLNRLRERLRESTSLTIKGRDAIAPARLNCFRLQKG